MRARIVKIGNSQGLRIPKIILEQTKLKDEVELKVQDHQIVISTPQSDEMNRFVSTIIVAPMTTKSSPYPTRVPLRFKGKRGHVVLDQIRTVDKARLVKRLGSIDAQTQSAVLSLLNEMFSP